MAAVVVVGVVVRAHDPLDRQARAVEDLAVGGDVDLLEVLEQRRARRTTGAASERSTTLSPLSAEIGIAAMSGSPTRRAEVGDVAGDGLELELVPVDEVHLVDGGHQVGHAEQRGDERVALGLLDDAVAGVDEHDRDVRGARRR